MPIDRRSFLLQGAGMAAALLGLNPLPSRADEPKRDTLQAATAPPGSDPGLRLCRPADPLQALIDGNARFVQAWAAADRAETPQARAQLLSELWAKHCYTPAHVLRAGQAPWAAVLACADARVAPEWIFSAALSDLFVVRAAGNTAFNDAVGSLEYGVGHLGIPLILVMGHSGCGAVQAARSSNPLTPSLTELVQPIRTSLTAGEALNASIKANARHSAAMLHSASALLRQAQACGKLAIRSSYYDIASGRVSLL